MRGCSAKWVLALAIAAALPLGAANADVLFTTSSDFTGWANSGGSATNSVGPSTAVDYDGLTTNGLGNNPGNSGGTLGAGQTTTGGSLQTTWNSSVGNFGVLAFAPGEAYNPAFMSAVDPGSTAAYQAPNYSAGSTVAHSGVIQMVYSVPDDTTAGSGDYFELGLDLSYPADNYYQTFFPDAANSAGVGSTTSLGTIGGQNWVLATIPYTITAGANNLTGFGFGIAYNSNYAPTQPIYIDAISTAATPEPASLGCLGAAMGMLLLRKRRHP